MQPTSRLPGLLKSEYACMELVTSIDDCRYADKKALDDHMETPPVKDMIAWMSSNPVVETATIRNLSWMNDMVFTKPEVMQQKDLFAVFADIKFESGKRDDTLKYWKANLDSSKEESGCFIYGFAHDPEKPDHLYTMEVYESEDYLFNTHVKAPAVQETIEKTKDVRSELTLSKLKLHAGFLSR